MSPKVSEEYKESRRQEIVMAAARVFARNGYERTTMKDVVEESGMSRGGVYMYFSNTEEMMLALLEAMDQENYDQMEAALQKGGGSAWSAMVCLMEDGEKDIARMMTGLAPAIYEFFLTGRRSSSHRELNERRFAKAIDVYCRLIAIGTERGEFRPIEDPAVIVRLIISMMDGLVLDSMILGVESIRLPEQMALSKRILSHLLQVQPISEKKEG